MSTEVDIMGAYFPGWLLAGIMGIILSALSNVVLKRLGLHSYLVWPVVFYLCLTFLWGAISWMVIFD